MLTSKRPERAGVSHNKRLAVLALRHLRKGGENHAHYFTYR